MRKITCDTCPTRPRSIACDLAPEALADFGTIGTSAIYRPRQVVFAEGGEATGLYLVCHGEVKVFCSDRFGHEHILGLAGPGSVLGELALDRTPLHAASAEATIESQIRFLRGERLVRYLESTPAVAVRLVAALSGELARSRRQVRDLALKGAESRLAAWILERAHAARSSAARDGNVDGATPRARVPIPFSRRDIAEMIGVSTETAIRLLARLRERGAIGIERGALVIVDAERLARVARHDETEA